MIFPGINVITLLLFTVYSLELVGVANIDKYVSKWKLEVEQSHWATHLENFSRVVGVGWEA